MKNKGFTLIELMIVCAIIAILAAIAVPQFQEYKKKQAAKSGKMVAPTETKEVKGTKAL